MKQRRLLAIFLGAVMLAAAAGCDDDDHPTNVTYCPPPVPSGVYSVTGDESVQIYWSPIRGASVERYGVYRSLTPDGAYQWLADVTATDDPHYIDSGLDNGTTYYYAVDAWSRHGESDLSYELVADTPRPAGTGLVVYDDLSDPDRAGLDLSRVQERGVGSDMVRAWDDPLADLYVIVLDGLYRLIPTSVEVDGDVFDNDIQDFGFTNDLDEIDFAPLEGWSRDGYGVELIEGHTYIVWTWDDHFAKFRVTALGEDRVYFDWAYQLSQDDIERRQLKMAVAAGPANPDSAPVTKIGSGSY